MKVTDRGPSVGPVYRYRVDIPKSNKTPLMEVTQWLKNNNIECTIMPGLALFHNQQDVTWFILRWA
jgi:hypothetical protein